MNYLHDDKMDYAIIGDSHECVEELRSLITRLEAEIPGVQIVLVGDTVDKGNNTEEMIRYLYERHLRNQDVRLRGNHEAFVHGRLEGIIGPMENPEREKEVFGSQATFLAKPELALMFAAMYDKAYPAFYIYPWDDEGGEHPVFVTHAPCSKVHLGQIDPASVRAQRNYRVKDRTVPVAQDLSWFYDEADENEPLHVFGHMAHSGKALAECQYKNKIFLDTGCVYGNGLSAVHIHDGKVAGYYFEPAIRNRNPHEILPPPLGLR